jgi:hypothetical protein
MMLRRFPPPWVKALEGRVFRATAPESRTLVKEMRALPICAADLKRARLSLI